MLARYGRGGSARRLTGAGEVIVQIGGAIAAIVAVARPIAPRILTIVDRIADDPDLRWEVANHMDAM